MKRLIVKGDRFQAARAAADHGVGLAFVRELRGNGAVETVGHSNASDVALAEWLTEDPHTAPYPPGALLFYSRATS